MLSTPNEINRLMGLLMRILARCLVFLFRWKIDVIKRNNPQVLALVETNMGGNQAEKIAKNLNYSGHTRVEANGFSSGI